MLRSSRCAAPAAAVFAVVLVISHLALVAPARAQSFNIDIDAPGSPPANGGGVPSSAFGAAANQAGVWNSYFSSPLSPMLDLNGNATPASVDITSTTTTPAVLSFLNSNNTGDFALLLNDGTQIGTTTQGGSRSYSINGLMDGPYSVVTYTARPQGIDGHLLVEVAGSNEGQLVAAGVPTGNTFTAGVTHVVHTLNVTGGTIDIRLVDVAGAPAGYVDGFQLTLVPEPAGVSVLLSLVLFLPRRRARARTRRGDRA